MNKGCTIKGVCGKEPATAGLMDVLIYAVRGEAIVNRALRAKGAADTAASRRILDALFSTITNANFDDEALKMRIAEALATKNRLIGTAEKRGIALPDMPEVKFHPAPSEYEAEAAKVGVLSMRDEDIRSLKQLIIYGVKGAAAYAEHALNLGHEDPSLYEMLENALAEVSREDIGADELTALVLNVGEAGVKAMALLDKANTSAYGDPEITKVNIGVGKRPGILVSGHDLKDFGELLEQTKDAGVDIYTHSEMLPAHYYPAFKKYSHFVGNYGNAWWKQRDEFETFNGVILFTTNCIVPPRPNAAYADRIYTTGSAGLPGATHIPDRKEGRPKDFSQLIEHAKKCPPPTEIEHGEIVGGFAHHQVLALADKVVDAVKSGAIRKFVVMAGCDGRMRQIPLQQTAAGRHRRHSARTRRRTMQRQLFAGAHRAGAEGGFRARERQRPADRLQHRVVRAEGRHRAAVAAGPRHQEHPRRAHAPGVPVAERTESADRQIRPRDHFDRGRRHEKPDL